MIITIVGLPGRLTTFCRDVCVELLTHVGQPPLTENVDTLSGLARHALAAGQRTLVVTATRPERDFLDAVREAGRPFLLVLDDPRRSVLHRAADGSVRARDAILEIGTSCACLMDVLGFARTVRVTHEGIGSDPSGFIAGLLEVLGFPAHDPALVGAARATVERHLVPMIAGVNEADIADQLESEFGPTWGLAAKAALGGYCTAFFDGKLGRLIAARDMFQPSDFPDTMLTDVIDATGRNRMLVFGPYMRIPRGQWTLRMTLAFSPELVGAPFSLDIVRADGGGLRELGRVSFGAISGRYVAQVTFAHDEPALGLEFRLFVDKATFDGKVAIGFAELERMEDQTPPDLGELMDWQSQGAG